jgi:hypothetical protein
MAMRGDTGFSHKTVVDDGDPTHGNCYYDGNQWWYAPNGPGNDPECVVSFDPEDGTRLNADGTETPRVDEETSQCATPSP